jgi:hypothetical protein
MYERACWFTSLCDPQLFADRDDAFHHMYNPYSFDLIVEYIEGWI